MLLLITNNLNTLKYIGPIQVHGDKKPKKVSEINVAINNTVTERVQSFNFLDVKLNETLSWKNHLAMVSKKISKAIGNLYRLKNVLPESVLYTLYNSLICVDS